MKNIFKSHLFTDPRWCERWRQFSVVVLTFGALAPIFKTYFTRPNSLSYSIGGDAFVLYYDMVYHMRYDHSPMLQGMNYPYGEYIFLTDAQGALATILRWFNQHVYEISSYACGIIHTTNLYLIPVCSILVYYILKSLGVRPLVRIPFSVLITILAPQMLRLKGHFGLAYAFLIPLAMLWFIRKYNNNGRLEWRDLGVLAVIVFFAYNNPYVGFGAAGLLISSGGVLSLLSIFLKKHLRTGLLTMGVGIISMLIPFLDFHFNDPNADRIAQQFGFFFYHASFSGLFYPPGSLLSHFLGFLGSKAPQLIQFESWINLGLVAGGLIIALMLRMVLGFILRKRKEQAAVVPFQLQILMLGALAMFVFAANASLYGWAKDFMEEHLGPLLMFKASGRLAWPLYFTVTISAIVFLDFLLRKIQSKAKAKTLVFFLIAIWGLEYNLYIGSRYQEVFHENYFSKPHEADLMAELQKKQVDPKDFGAILSLPRMMAWSDLLRSELNWGAQFYSLRISAATGLPLLNAMLSRISTGQCAEGVQLTSNLLIPRDRLAKLPNRKDILIVLGSDKRFLKLTESEQQLLDIAQPILEDRFVSLYRLSWDKIEQTQAALSDAARTQFQQQTAAPPDHYLHLSFDENVTKNSFYGKGAYRVKKGMQLVAELPLPIQSDTQYLFSAWHHIDYSRFDMGFWHLTVLDSAGNEVSKTIADAVTGNDPQDGWLQVSQYFNAPKSSSLRIEIDCSREIFVDELLVRPKGSTVIYDLSDEKDFIWNGYRVPKTDGKTGID